MSWPIGAASDKSSSIVDVDLVAAQFDVLDSDTHKTALLEDIRARDTYRRLVEELKDKIKKLELGLLGPKSQRFKSKDDPLLSLEILAELLGRAEGESADAQALTEELLAKTEHETQASDENDAAHGGGGDDGDVDDVKLHRRSRKPTGRRTAREEVVHKVTIERLPEEVQRLGLDAFERIGEDPMITLERRVAAQFEVTVIRPKFRAKTDAAVDAVKQARADATWCPKLRTALVQHLRRRRRNQVRRSTRLLLTERAAALRLGAEYSPAHSSNRW